MTDKDKKIIEKIVKKALADIFYENNADEFCDSTADYTIPTKCIDEIERHMGRPITFMGIS